jgi:hypothetical protein
VTVGVALLLVGIAVLVARFDGFLHALPWSELANNEGLDADELDITEE